MSSQPVNAEREELALQAAETVLQPLARLCIGHGIPFARVEELFKRAYVRAARDARRQAGAAAHRDVSQVAVATGLNRRDVQRLTAELAPRAAQRMSPASQVYTEWLSNRAYRHANGHLRKLPRQGPGLSFESLAASVTRHVHARSLLDELLRLGLVHWDEAADTVLPRRDRVVPQADLGRLYGFLGANVGDHLAAATENVLSGERRHVEQAVFSDALSGASMPAAREIVQKQWRQVLEHLVPALEALIAADRAAGRPADQRLRVGFYSFHEPLESAAPAATESPDERPDADADTDAEAEADPDPGP